MIKLSNELLGKAVEDSRRKAEILAKAAGVGLGDVITIDYSWGEICIMSEPIDRPMKCMAEEADCSDAYNIDIEPDDIDVADTVTVIWELK